jgi:hypothetical protein
MPPPPEISDALESVVGIYFSSIRHRERAAFILMDEQGARSVELRASELAMILDGIDVSKLKRLPRYQRAIESRG